MGKVKNPIEKKITYICPGCERVLKKRDLKTKLKHSGKPLGICLDCLPAFEQEQEQQDVWDGQCAGALCGEGIPLHELTPEQRANAAFMRGWSETGELQEWIGDDV
jgi:hypothetical protein